MSLLTSLAHASLVGGAASSGAAAPVLSASRPIVEEGDEVQFILYVPDGVEGSTYAYSITGITANDLFYGTLTGNFTLDSLQSGQVSIILATDSVVEIETITMAVSSLNLSVQVTITDTSPAPVGESIYDYPGGYQWVCPAGVTSVSVVAIGGGGNGGYITNTNGSSRAGGGGGGLGWKNNIAVTPGTSYSVVVNGWYGQGSTSGSSSFINHTVVSGGLGGSAYSSYNGQAGGSYIGDGGGNGGSSATMSSSTSSRRLGGGGGGGGYLNAGGAGGASNSAGTGSNTGGGGGGSGYYVHSYNGAGGFGGGTGLFGTGGGSPTSGGAYAEYAGTGGMYNPVTYPTTGNWVNNSSGYGRAAQRFGGGGGAITSSNLISNFGGPGGVRIMWGGGRSFPNNAGYLAPPNGGTSVTLQQTLDNPNAYSTTANDNFGDKVAIDGNYAIVGAYPEDDAGGANSGKAYIFNVTTGALLHTLDNPNAYDTSASDYFGSSVAISGNYAIVGAYGEDDAGAGGVSGKAYIFNVTTGELVHTLNNPNAYSISADDRFGVSVAISGNYAIVGAYFEDDAGGNQSGKAYIFNVTTGALLHTLDNPNAYSTSAGDRFGVSVAISGNYAIVGAYQEADAGGTLSGKAYIFNVTTGGLLHTLDNQNAYDTSAGDTFGRSVGISGNYAIVSAQGEDDAGGGTSSGKAYIFDVTTGTLLHTLDNQNAYDTSAFDLFGNDLAISGNYVIVGAYLEDDGGTGLGTQGGTGLGSGKAYIYRLDQT